MANEIRTKLDAWTNFSIAGTASLNTANAVQSAMISNTTLRPAALVDLKMFTSAAGATAGTVYELFLIRGDNAGNRDDNAVAGTAAITIENSPLLGTLVVTNTGSKNFQRIFDTAALGKLGTEFGIAVRNSTGQTSNATQQSPRYALYLPEIQ